MIKSVKILGNELTERTFVESFEFSPLTILYACNGSGKSSLLNALSDINKKGFELEIEGTYKGIATYKNSKDNHVNLNPSPNDSKFTDKAISVMYSKNRSEGENIMISILEFIEDIMNDDKIDVVLMDEVDSGLSVEHVNIVFHHIVEMVQNGKQVIFTCNTYHPIFITRKFTNMMTGKIENCNSYEEFYGVAVESRNNLVKQGKIPKYFSF